VLVLTLGLLVLAATVTVGVSRASLHHAAAARRATHDLQRRWGTASIARTLLPRAESILANAEAEQAAPVRSVRRRLQLGDMSYEIVVSDEQAKANVNLMLDRSNPTWVQDRLAEALGGGPIARALRVRPALAEVLPPAQLGALPQYVTGFGQVFDLTDISPAPNELLTIWGDGRVNLRRASEQSARLALTPPLTRIEVQKLVSSDQNPLQQRLESADVASSYGGRSLPVTLRSACHSVWVICEDGRRLWHEVHVLDESDPNQPRKEALSW
jgi:hypothetical protein